jgi:hypothetical protein
VQLATIDVSSWSLSAIGAVDPDISICDLTTDREARLYAFYALGAGSVLGHVDPITARLLGEDALRVQRGSAWAFAFADDRFWLFTASSLGSASSITKYNPVTKVEEDAGTVPSTVVGAGVAHCAQ